MPREKARGAVDGLSEKIVLERSVCVEADGEGVFCKSCDVEKPESRFVRGAENEIDAWRKRRDFSDKRWLDDGGF